MGSSEGAFSPGRASFERKARVAQSFSISPDSAFSSLRLELWGEGKTRAVFDLGRHDYQTPERTIKKEQYRASLVKVDKGATEVAIRDVLTYGGADISEKTREIFSRRLISERFSRKAFAADFGDLILPEKTFLRKIPLTREIIAEFFPKISLPRTLPSPCELTTLVYVQRKAPQEAFGDDSYDVLFRCAELVESPSDSALFQGNRAFIDLHASWHDIRQLAGISPEVQEIMRLAREDAGLCTLLQDFLRRAHAYTEKTGEIIDVFGTHNVRMYKDASRTWRMLFIDALARGQAFAKACHAMHAVKLGYPIVENEALALASSLNYARNMNALALTVNAPERFRLSPSDIAPDIQKLLPILRRALVSS